MRIRGNNKLLLIIEQTNQRRKIKMTLTEKKYQEIIHTPIIQSSWSHYVRKSWGFHHVTLNFGGRRKLYLTLKNINDAVNKMIDMKLLSKADLKKLNWDVVNNIFMFMATEKGFKA